MIQFIGALLPTDPFFLLYSVGRAACLLFLFRTIKSNLDKDSVNLNKDSV